MIKIVFLFVLGGVFKLYTHIRLLGLDIEVVDFLLLG